MAPTLLHFACVFLPHLFKSTDAGLHWIPLTSPPIAVFDVACDPTDANVVYIVGFDFAPSPGPESMRSTDGGQTFAAFTNGLPIDAYPRLLVASASDCPQLLTAGVSSCFERSIDFPDLAAALDRSIVWPPDHLMANIHVDVTVHDTCDPAATFALTSITSDEP